MTNNPTRLLTPDDLCAMLGVSVATIYYWRSKHAGPQAIKIGRHLRYRPADVKHWLDAQS